MNVYKKIHYNQEIIASLKADEYPELARLRKKTTVIAHLYALMAHMLTYSSPVWPDRGRQYYREKCEEWILTKEVIEHFISPAGTRALPAG